MATNIKTVMTYPLDGTTTDFAIPFEYLARKFVQVTLIGVDRKVLVLNQDYRFATKAIISTTRAWGTGDGYNTIEIRRYTSATERLVDFTDGSILRAYDLNVSQIQTLHVAEEARDLTADTIGVNNDGNLDARGRRIVNVGDAVESGDAINLGQITSWNDSALNSKNAAKISEDNAKLSEINSKASEDNSKRSETNAGASEGLAKKWAENPRNVPVQGTSEFSAYHHALNSQAAATASQNSAGVSASSATASKASEDNAKVSEANAKADADRAEVEANKLGNMNEFAGTLKDITAPIGTTTGSGSVNFKTTYAVSAPVLRAAKGAVTIGIERDAGDPVNSSYIQAFNGTTSLGRILFKDSGDWDFISPNNGAGRKVEFYVDNVAMRNTWAQQGFNTVVSGVGHTLKATSNLSNAGAANIVFTRYGLVGRQGAGSDPEAYGSAGIREIVGNYYEYFIDVGGFGKSAWYSFRNDGTLRMAAATYQSDGNIIGNAWGGRALSQHLADTYIADVYIGSARSVRVGENPADVWAGKGEFLKGFSQEATTVWIIGWIRMAPIWKRLGNGNSYIIEG